MEHQVCRVVEFEIVGPYSLRVTFSDGKAQVIDFKPVLKGVLYGPLQDRGLFNQVEIDPEIHTLVWPNGADFDPATLYDWPDYLESMKKLAKQWESKKIEIA